MVDYSPHPALRHIWKEYLVKKEGVDSVLSANTDEKQAYEEQLREKDRQINAEKDKRKRPRMKVSGKNVFKLQQLILKPHDSISKRKNNKKG